ncbi:MAG: CinA family nicotinamide mononucleotide deamidase-related protein [Bacteroidales bacterium]|nr:CinA family nicotinamide mononucleotide deamidase-related protein [Bacteroidales bacterium]
MSSNSITAAICTIGDEILIGQIVDTNSSFIARALESHGIKVRTMLSIGDERGEILSNLSHCLACHDIVVTTGGLGPTKDDITKSVLGELSKATGTFESAEQLAVIERILSARGIEMLPANRAQATVPDSCRVIVNKLGTAPNMEFEFQPEQFGHKAVLYALPGVPHEAEGAIPDVLKSIEGKFETGRILHRTLVTFGLAESVLAEKIAQWEDNLPEFLHLAYLPNSIIGVRLRLSCYDADIAGREELLNTMFSELRDILGSYVYGEGEDTLYNILPRLLQGPPVASRQETLAVAESCTGGLISHLITSVPGCSAFYKGSVTSYANDVKASVIAVPAEIIETYGAVSRQTAEAMARGVLEALGSDYSIATTGVAGPDGGTDEKPVGTCWMAVAHRNENGEVEIFAKCHHSGSRLREVNIRRFAANALNMLRLMISQQLFID